MRMPAAAELLAVWERGRERSSAERALMLLAALYPETPIDTLATVSVGWRDSALMRLRERLFGSVLNGVSACPDCGQLLDVEFNLRDMAAFDTPPDTVEAVYAVHVDGDEITFRLPNSLDLVALEGADTLDSAQRLLFSRCVQWAVHDGVAYAPDTLSEAAASAIAQAMAQADPNADIELALTCPHCGHNWTSAFDIVSFLWRELQSWVARTLIDVHMLARAYGWSESDILALSGWRRQYYIGLVGG